MSVYFVAAELVADSPGHGSAVFQLPDSIASNVDYDRYRSNSLLAWAHSWEEEPIGTADQIVIDGSTVQMQFRLDPNTKYHGKVSRGFIRTAEMLFEQPESGGPWELMDVSLVSHATPNEERQDADDLLSRGGPKLSCSSGKCVCINCRLDRADPPPKKEPVMSQPTISQKWNQPLAASRGEVMLDARTDSTDPDGEVRRRANIITLNGPHESESVRLLREARARDAQRRLDAGEPVHPPTQRQTGIPQRWREPLAASAPGWTPRGGGEAA